MRAVLLLILTCSLFCACGLSSRIQKTAQKTVLASAALRTAHVGISVYEPAAGKWWYNYQGDKYFVPASNTKLATCYAAMKYLGDSLVGGRIAIDDQNRLRIFPTGDPTFLNSEFRHQPLLEKIKGYSSILLSVDGWKEERWGSGWSWNDYDAAYMAERSPLPVYGNVASFRMVADTLQTIPSKLPVAAAPDLGFDKKSYVTSTKSFQIQRRLDENEFFLKPAPGKFTTATIPLRTDAGIISKLLEDTLKADVASSVTAAGFNYHPQTRAIHSQPTDSLLKPMMHRSDNFFAEQSLLMVSNEVLGFMNDEKIIDTLLKTDFSDLPQKPRWVDGSGLSRYNLFTPQDLVMILDKMKRQAGMDRIRAILPTGNEGTLAGYYKADSTSLYAKTGTLSGVVAISGFMTTAGGRELVFSVLVNNHQASATQVRRAVEGFLQSLRKEH
ncbi:MAG TPA: D-alanyl-D-alanine carboxypeptidase/D-alanyl-D-alanine-endopeptidase [Flavisolibacter sp.]|nr:D-alanyl-D-alanine carboxypeptidase/D-alanyl-D-alanine-endopeptidase [Flavisolibacter sp.]